MSGNKSLLTWLWEVFDNGTFKDDPHGARQVVNGMIAIMDKDQADLNGNFQQHYPKSSYINGILNVFESVWKRVVMDSTIGQWSILKVEVRVLTIERVTSRYSSSVFCFNERIFGCNTAASRLEISRPISVFWWAACYEERIGRSVTLLCSCGVCQKDNRFDKNWHPFRYALKLRLPNTVFENTSIQEIQRIGIDFIVL